MISVCILALCAGSVLAQSKQFICASPAGATSIGKVTVTVPTKVEDIQGETHHIGTVTIGRAGHMMFWVSWDATAPSISVGRTDDDGFEAAAISSGGEITILRSKRPNEVEVQMGCFSR